MILSYLGVSEQQKMCCLSKDLLHRTNKYIEWNLVKAIKAQRQTVRDRHRPQIIHELDEEQVEDPMLIENDVARKRKKPTVQEDIIKWKEDFAIRVNEKVSRDEIEELQRQKRKLQMEIQEQQDALRKAEFQLLEQQYKKQSDELQS